MCEAINNEKYIWTVYMHSNKINNKKYIGITSRPPEIRWGNNGSQYTRQKNPCFYNAIQKYGWDNFEHIILFEHLTEQEAKEKEKELIAKYHTCVYDDIKMGYNMTFGGEGLLGHIMSEETKKKMSEAHSGEKNHMFGKTLSEEVRQHMSEIRKGKRTGEENPFYGQQHSEKTKKQLSDIAKTKTGKQNPNYRTGKYTTEYIQNKRKRRAEAREIFCVELNQTFASASVAATELNLDISSICKCCKGQCNHVHNYHFRYVIDRCDDNIKEEEDQDGYKSN